MRALRVLLGVVALLVETAAVGATLDAQHWDHYRNRFITPDGRVVDNANGNVSHSEGQGYGMLLAVAAGDRPTFEKLWRWTATNLAIRGDALFAWRWIPAGSEHATDHNNATDGDLLIAWALGRAAQRFHEPAYAQSAQRIAGALRRQLLRDSAFGPLLLPGSSGFESDQALVINPSYLIFPAFRELSRWDPSPQWGRLGRSGRAVLRRALKQYQGLPPDWVAVTEGGLQKAANLPLRFGYDALRVPLYCYWGGDEALLDLPRFAALWQRDEAPAWLALDSASHADAPLSGAHLAVRWLVRQVMAEQGGRPLSPPPKLPGDYYGATITLLAELAWAERHE